MGGIAGLLLLALLIVFCRYTRIPLAALLNLLPFLLPYVQKARAQQSPKPSSSAMTRDEARLILGLGPQATPEEIREAHRRLIQKNHPDSGGSDYLAAQINQARDVLLN